jgi:hypothetical protein
VPSRVGGTLTACMLTCMPDCCKKLCAALYIWFLVSSYCPFLSGLTPSNAQNRIRVAFQTWADNVNQQLKATAGDNDHFDQAASAESSVYHSDNPAMPAHRFGGIGSNLSAIEYSVKIHSEQISAMDVKMSAMDQKLDAILDRLKQSQATSITPVSREVPLTLNALPSVKADVVLGEVMTRVENMNKFAPRLLGNAL